MFIKRVFIIVCVSVFLASCAITYDTPERPYWDWSYNYKYPRPVSHTLKPQPKQPKPKKDDNVIIIYVK